MPQVVLHLLGAPRALMAPRHRQPLTVAHLARVLQQHGWQQVAWRQAVP